MDKLVETNIEWSEHSLCQYDPELFFPEYGYATEYLQEAKRICDRCPVFTNCLDYITNYELRHGSELGFYAGLSSLQRTRKRNRNGKGTAFAY